MTNPAIQSALGVTELAERYELTSAGADADKLDDIDVVVSRN